LQYLLKKNRARGDHFEGRELNSLTYTQQDTLTVTTQGYVRSEVLSSLAD
jgi:hypothetical protein